jgi:UDPglucose 6-dehydrogenase
MSNNITVIGIGKLGLGFALLLERAGYNIVGVDIFPEYVQKINDKTIQFTEPGYNELLQNATKLRATTNLREGLDHSDMIFLIVQTPNGGGSKFYDHTILSNLLEKINKEQPHNKTIVIGCTVMPNYINQVGKLLLQDCPNANLCYNPEFVAQGDIVNGFEKPDIILFGLENPDQNIELKQHVEEIYTKMTKNQPKFCFMTPTEAEIVKISLNGFITTKISFANMVTDLCESMSRMSNMSVNASTVLNAIGSDSRIGTKYFRPGYSFGGPCFPRDTKALKLLMDQNGIQSNLLKSTTEYNETHIEIQAKQMLEDIQDQTIVIENVCYKENSKIPIIEESAKLKIALYLKQAGRRIIIKDTEEIIREVKKEYGNLFEYIYQ